MRQALAAFWSMILEVCMTGQASAKAVRNLADYAEETSRSFVEEERSLRTQRLAAAKPTE